MVWQIERLRLIDRKMLAQQGAAQQVMRVFLPAPPQFHSRIAQNHGVRLMLAAQAHPRGQMTSGGETHACNPVRVKMPGIGVFPHQLDCLRRFRQRRASVCILPDRIAKHKRLKPSGSIA
jgi:hypothetical protein